MPKATDIVGTIRVPEAGYGRFWNFMKTMPGAEFTPLLEAKTPEPSTPKRSKGKTSEGTTGKCIVLAALQHSADEGEGTLTPAQLTDAIVQAGKAPKSIGNILHELVKNKQIRRDRDGVYTITAAGTKYFNTSCPVAEG